VSKLDLGKPYFDTLTVTKEENAVVVFLNLREERKKMRDAR